MVTVVTVVMVVVAAEGGLYLCVVVESVCECVNNTSGMEEVDVGVSCCIGGIRTTARRREMSI